VREAVIVSTARTPIGKAYRGTLSDISGPQLAAHALSAALDRAGVTGEEIDDVILGCAMQEGTTGYNVARQAALRASLPVTVPGMTVDRQCGSGLMAIAIAAKQIIADGMAITVGGGVESISLVQNAHQNTYRAHDPWLAGRERSVYISMLDTAENVAGRYRISRDAQDAFALASQQRTAAAQRNGLFAGEIVPISGTRPDENGELVPFTLELDEGNRPGTSAEGLAGLKPVLGHRTSPTVTAGNASQLSDGASAAVLMEAGEAARRGLAPLGAYRGSPWPDASPTRWASARSSPCRPCCAAMASPSMTSTCGNSTKPSPPRPCTAVTGSASTRTRSTSTAAPSPSGTPTA